MPLNKKTFVLRISEDMFNRLSRWADDDFRSVNGQIEMILDKALKEAGRKSDQNSKRITEKAKLGK